MKKKLFLIVTIIMLTVFACMVLVACGGNDGNSGNNEYVEGDDNNSGNNQGGDSSGGDQNNEDIVSPETIKEFFDVWLESSKKSFNQTTYGGATIVINGNTYWQCGNNYSAYLDITGKNKANCFSGPKDSTNLDDWDIKKLETIDEIRDYFFVDDENYLQEINSPKDIINYLTYTRCFNGTDVKNDDFEKKDDIYVGKEGSGFENCTIKIDDKVLTLTVVNEMIGNQEPWVFVFALGSDPIEIPEFLKDALDNEGEEQPPVTLNTPKDFMDKYVASYEKVCTVVENVKTQKLSLKGNIIKFKENYDGELQETYYELINENINRYDYSNSWSASTISKSEMTEGEYYDFSNVASSDFMRELFNKSQNIGLYGWLGEFKYIALAFDLNNLDYIDGAFYGKAGTDAEGNKFEVNDNKFIVTYLSDDPDFTFKITFEIGCGTIEIPQEAKDALENGGNQEGEEIAPSEFIAKFNEATNKKFYLTKGDVTRGVAIENNKIAAEIIKNNVGELAIFELTEKFLNDYKLNAEGEWIAYPYTNNGISNFLEIFNASMEEVFDTTETTDLFDVIEAACNIENLVFADGKYTGKVGTLVEGFTIIVSNNEMVFKSNDVEFKYTIGGVQIDIPQEALDAMEEYWKENPEG